MDFTMSHYDFEEDINKNFEKEFKRELERELKRKNTNEKHVPVKKESFSGWNFLFCSRERFQKSSLS